MPFLDTLSSRDNERLNIDVYRKPTHTDRYLDFRSRHDREHKTSTAATLLHRALKLSNSEAGKAHEIALFTVNFAYLHYNVIQPLCEAISGYFVVLARNCLAHTLDYIVMQMKKTNPEKGHMIALAPGYNLMATHKKSLLVS